MGDLQYYDFFRIVAAIVYSVAAFYTIKAAKTRWDAYTSTDKDYLWVYCALVFLMATGMLEAIRRDTIWDWRTVCGILISIVAIRAAIRGRNSLRAFHLRAQEKALLRQALELAEKRVEEGTASSEEIVYFLRLAKIRNELEERKDDK